MNLSLHPDQLKIDLLWYEQLWAFHLDSAIAIPYHHILNATTAEPLSNWREIRAPGTFLPGVIKAGTYYTHRGKEFWYVTAETNYLTLELNDEYYKRIVLTIENSQTWADQINQRIAASGV